MIVLLSAGIAGAGAYTPASPTPTGASQVKFVGHVYYSDGTTPVSGAQVFIYYPSSASTSTEFTTSDAGSYASGWMAFNGKSVGYIVYKDGTKYFDGNDANTVMNTGSPVTVTRDFTISLAAPRPTVDFQGHVTYGGSGVPATISINYGGAPWTITADSTGFYDLAVFYAGGSATIHASYDGQTSSDRTVTPGSDSVVTTDITVPPGASTSGGYMIQGHAYYNGHPISGIGIWVSSSAGTGGMNASSDGSFSISSVFLDSSDRTYWARYNGIDSPTYVMTPVDGHTFTHDFYITGPALPTATATATSTATPVPSATATIRPTPLPSPTVTIAAGATVTPAATTTPTMAANATGNATLTSSPTVGPTATISPSAASPAGGLPVTYLAIGLILVVVVLAAAMFLVLRKKP